eukprot:15266521-Alexandrium_andersonii.AAC.1
MVQEHCFLVLGGFLAEEAEDKRVDYWTDFLRKGLGVRLRRVRADPTYERDGELEGRAFWLRPVAPEAEDRKKLFRKQ